MRRLFAIGGIGIFVVLGCSEPAATLSVQLRSDLAPGDELFEARTTFFDAERTRRLAEQRRPVARGTDLAAGASVAELDVVPGPYTVEVDALGPDGRSVGRRRVLVNVEGPMVLTVILSRDCRDVSCPGAGDPRDATECIGGRCVAPDCVSGGGDGCMRECTADSECAPTVACADGQCTDGLCLFPPRDGACPAGERCDPDVGCVAETVLPDAGVPTAASVGADGSVACSGADACDDGLFCNGTDSCASGSCSAHAGNPCGAMCDEEADRCVACASDGDCPRASTGAWSRCGGFGGTCGESGTRTRDVTSYRCASGACEATTTTETGSCSRDTSGVSCGADVVGAWGSCRGTGTCPTSGEQSRTVTTHTCAAGACRSSDSTETQSCSLDPAGDPCDDGDPCTDPDVCTATGTCRGVPECRPASCGGACRIPVCTGACLDYCDCI